MSRYVLVLVLLGLSCAQQPDVDAERAAIAKADSAWLAAAQAGDVEATLGIWTPSP